MLLNKAHFQERVLLSALARTRPATGPSQERDRRTGSDRAQTARAWPRGSRWGREGLGARGPFQLPEIPPFPGHPAPASPLPAPPSWEPPADARWPPLCSQFTARIHILRDSGVNYSPVGSPGRASPRPTTCSLHLWLHRGNWRGGFHCWKVEAATHPRRAGQGAGEAEGHVGVAGEAAGVLWTLWLYPRPRTIPCLCKIYNGLRK